VFCLRGHGRRADVRGVRHHGLKKLNSTGWKRVLGALDRGEDLELVEARRRREMRQRDEHAKARRNSEIAASYWRSSLAAMGTIVEFYLRSRSIHLVPPPCVLRLLGTMMLARVVDVEGRGVAIHPTWLPPNGVWSPGSKLQRKMLGPCGGGAVRFGDGSEIVVCEGLESALSCVQALRLPAYAALSATGIQLLALPPHVRRVTVFADCDDHGEGIRAATEAAQRWRREGRDARVAMVNGADANDVLRRDDEQRDKQR
jgi:putative DNA primase/helicase